MIQLLIKLLIAFQAQNSEAICKAAHAMNDHDSKQAIELMQSIEPDHAFDFCF